MRSLLSVLLLSCALAGGCSKRQTQETTPPPAAPAPAAEEARSTPPSQDVDPNAPNVVADGEPAPSGYADPGPRPASLTDADIAFANKLIAAIDKLATTINNAGADCPKVASAIRALSGEMKVISEEGKKFDARIAGDEAAKKWLEATYAPKAMSSMNTAMGNPCLSDQAVQDAMADLKM